MMTPDERDAAMRQLAGRISETCAGQDMGVAIGAACLYIVVQAEQAGTAALMADAAYKLRAVADLLDPKDPT